MGRKARVRHSKGCGITNALMSLFLPRLAQWGEDRESLLGWHGTLFKGKREGMLVSSKTKPKKRVDPYMPPVKFDQLERKHLAIELLGFDSVVKASDILTKLEFLLTFSFNSIRRLDEMPQPAHIRAELQPIMDAAQKLSALIHPSVLTPQAMSRLPQSIGQLWYDLQDLELHAGEILSFLHLEGASDGGALRNRNKVEIDYEQSQLTKFFKQHAIEPGDGDLKEFIAFCQKKRQT
jgi:hypothetical protein